MGIARECDGVTHGAIRFLLHLIVVGSACRVIERKSTINI